MQSKAISAGFLIVLVAACLCRGAACGDHAAVGAQVKKKKCSRSDSIEANKSTAVDAVLKKLNQATAGLKSYQCRIEHIVSQPLLETKTLRRGGLYYLKSAKTSKLRINFDTIAHDDEDEQKHTEEYVINGDGLAKIGINLEGVWLCHLDHQIKQPKLYQLAEPDANQAVDAFELISRNFPLVGFTKTDQLRRDFEIELVTQKPGKKEPLVQLHLKVKPDSVYRQDYTALDFWIDDKTSLPVRILSYSTEEDVYEINLIGPKVNKKVADELFQIKIPKSFGKPEIIPLRNEKDGN